MNTKIPILNKEVIDKVKKAEYIAPLSFSSLQTSRNESTLEKNNFSSKRTKPNPSPINCKDNISNSIYQINKEDDKLNFKKDTNFSLPNNNIKHNNIISKTTSMSVNNVSLKEQKNNNSSVVYNKQELKDLLIELQKKKNEQEELCKNKKLLMKQLDSVKNELSSLMKDQKNLSIDTIEVVRKNRKVKKRIYFKDILDVVENIYGKDALDKVLIKLEEIHNNKNNNQYEIKLLT